MNKTTMIILCGLGLLGVFMPESAFATTTGDFAAEVTKIEALITGGYMRIGLLGICGAVAIIGAMKQSGMVFVTGLGACFFVLIMKGWVTTNFACSI